jgi:ferric-chelate reductase
MLTDFADSQAVLLVAGGSGITFAASILEELIGQACKGGIRTRSITLIWYAWLGFSVRSR